MLNIVFVWKEELLGMAAALGLHTGPAQLPRVPLWLREER